jgi:hypothetical protein
VPNAIQMKKGLTFVEYVEGTKEIKNQQAYIIV